ncbi:MAG: carboxypeptidase-like regulatory domain-containing protein [Planctomycetota bacterium]|nr:carboxypeptidase-like regulatory domain-containing protein [Planctomycetota bacterium]
MKAYGGVFTHPFFAVTGADGAFAFPMKLLPGKYKLKAWHEVYGAQDLEIEIDKRNSRQELNVEFKP